jgi:hypothetical protein
VAQPLLSLGRAGQWLPPAALAALGVAALYKASGLPFGSLREPGSGFFPVLIGVALVVFAAASLFDARQPQAEADGKARGELPVWVVVVALAAYAVALTRVGFVLCTAAVVLLLLRGISAVPWPASVAIAAIASIACYALFTRLGVPLPAGILGF